MANGIYRRSGSLLVILLGTAWVAPASVARFTTTPGQPSATVPGRTTEDRADDTTGYQIHALYVLPSDAEDQLIFTLQPWNSGLLDVYLTYPFVVTDSQGQCQAIYLSTAKRAEAIIRN